MTDAYALNRKSAVLAVVFGLPGPRTSMAVEALQAITRIALEQCSAVEVNSIAEWNEACNARESLIAISQYPSPDVCVDIARSAVPAMIVTDSPLHALAQLARDPNAGIAALRAVSASAACLAEFHVRESESIREANADNLDAFIVRVGEQSRLEIGDKELETLEHHVRNLSGLDSAPVHEPDFVVPTAQLIELAEAVLPRWIDTDEPGYTCRVEWPSSVFLLGDCPDTPMMGPFELAGPARCILYGPYMHLPAGDWSAQVTLQLAGCSGSRWFTLEVVCQDALAKGRFECHGPGTFETRLEFAHSRPHTALELRLFLDAGEIFGSLASFEIAMRLMA